MPVVRGRPGAPTPHFPHFLILTAFLPSCVVLVVCVRVCAVEDESKAYPPTAKHKELKAILESLEPEEALDDAAAKEELHDFLHDRLIPCEPAEGPAGTLGNHVEGVASIHARQEAEKLRENRTLFQSKSANKSLKRCFCDKRKQADACSFQIGQVATALEKEVPRMHSHFVKKDNNTRRLQAAVQEFLKLPVESIPQRSNLPRGTVFGWKYGFNPAASTSASSPQSPEMVGED